VLPAFEVPAFIRPGDLACRDTRSSALDLIWVADISYWPTAEGFLHVAAVMDPFNPRIVGSAMAQHLRAEPMIDAVEMATKRCQPAPDLIHHSDQGSQHISSASGGGCGEAGIFAWRRQPSGVREEVRSRARLLSD
jgi:putative transposase